MEHPAHPYLYIESTDSMIYQNIALANSSKRGSLRLAPISMELAERRRMDSAEEQEIAPGEDASANRYDILLVGRTGQGRSTTANKLLGGGDFKTGHDSGSVTSECRLGEKGGVRILDTPGFANTQLSQVVGGAECNVEVYGQILREQKKHELAFRRVLYFLPRRGPLERADGVLQEEIKVMHDFSGMDIFNVMIIVATNRKDPRYQTEFDEEDISSTQRAFVSAFETVTGQTLAKCPPILYLPFVETELLKRVKAAEILTDTPFKIKELTVQVHSPPDVLGFIQEKREEYPCKKLFFEVQCSYCADQIIYEDLPMGLQAVTAKEAGNEVPVEESKCHPNFIPKHTIVTKILGGLAHIVTFCVFAVIGSCYEMSFWPGFTNLDKVCTVCRRPPGEIGCSVVGEPGGHSTVLDDVNAEK